MNRRTKNKVKNLETLNLFIENEEKEKMKELNYLLPFLIKEFEDVDFWILFIFSLFYSFFRIFKVNEWNKLF